MILAVLGGGLLLLGIVAVVAGVLPAPEALTLGERVAPVLGFVVAITVVAVIAAEAGVFDRLADGAARLARGRGGVLWLLVVAVSVVSTVFLSLDTTAVLLTPVVVVLARRVGLSPIPFAMTTVWLANTGSLLLPVSNLTNLLAESDPRLRLRLRDPVLAAVARRRGRARADPRGRLPARAAASLRSACAGAGRGPRAAPGRGGGPGAAGARPRDRRARARRARLGARDDRGRGARRRGRPASAAPAAGAGAADPPRAVRLRAVPRGHRARPAGAHRPALDGCRPGRGRARAAPPRRGGDRDREPGGQPARLPRRSSRSRAASTGCSRCSSR